MTGMSIDDASPKHFSHVETCIRLCRCHFPEWDIFNGVLILFSWALHRGISIRGVSLGGALGHAFLGQIPKQNLPWGFGLSLASGAQKGISALLGCSRISRKNAGVFHV